MRSWLQPKVQGWQYNPYGSRRHNFAFYYLTGHSLIKSLKAAIVKPYKPRKEV